jgi:VanZ family protein
MKKFIFNWFPVLVYAALIYLLSSFPIQVPVRGDKVLHFLEYSLLGFLATRGFLLSYDLSKLWAGFLGALSGGLWGILDEFHQSFVPGRRASFGDVGADLLGSCAGALLFIYLGTWLFRNMKLYKTSCR